MQKSTIILVSLFVLAVLVMGCAKKPMCINECAFNGTQCLGEGFYVCGDKNNDGCFERSLVTACGEGYVCSDVKTCMHPTEPSVMKVVAAEEEGCTVVERVSPTEVIVRCETAPNTKNTTSYRLDCTQNCDRGLQVIKMEYRALQNATYSDEFVVSLQNANQRKCAMTCMVLQGTIASGNSMFTVASGVTQDVALRTRTPSNMQLLCTEVLSASNTECTDRIREVFTSRWVGPAQSY